MKLTDFKVDISLYTSQSQIMRVLTESWVKNFSFCPSCLVPLLQYENNRPVADFYCKDCLEQFELKSKKGLVGSKIVDGAFSTMIKRIESSTNPNFYFLNYVKDSLDVSNFFLIPKFFFVKSLIEKRSPLSENARRSGWVGCNILLKNIPKSGRIYYVKDSVSLNKELVNKNWNQVIFLESQTNEKSKGWTLDTMMCLDEINQETFSLDSLYSFETKLSIKYPKNKHIKDKLRQQLQILRDKGLVEFIGRGKYRKI